jgi:hypothetical protein
MRKSFYLLVLAGVLVTFFAGVSYAVDVTGGGDIELVYDSYNVDNGTTDVSSVDFGTTDADVNVKIGIDENTSAHIKIDVDDDGTQMEEVYITFDKVGGSPVSLKLGKQEVPFGMDKDLGIMDPVAHIAEVDEKVGLTLAATPAGDSPKIELCSFQNDTAQDYDPASGEDPADTGIFQSYALRLTSTRVAGLFAEVSYINQHREGLEELAATNSDDTSAVSVGLDYTFNPVNVYLEYIGMTDTGHVDGDDDTILHLGVAYEASPQVTVVVQYGNVTSESDASPAEPSLTTFALTTFALTPKYKMSNNVELALEYASETYDADIAGVDDIDISSVAIRAKYSF